MSIEDISKRLSSSTARGTKTIDAIESGARGARILAVSRVAPGRLVLQDPTWRAVFWWDTVPERASVVLWGNTADATNSLTGVASRLGDEDHDMTMNAVLKEVQRRQSMPFVPDVPGTHKKTSSRGKAAREDDPVRTGKLNFSDGPIDIKPKRGKKK